MRENTGAQFSAQYFSSTCIQSDTAVAHTAVARSAVECVSLVQKENR